ELHFNRSAALRTESTENSHHINVRDIADMAADYDQTAGLAFEDAAFYRHRAQVRFHQGHFAAAIADYSAAITLTPSAYAYYHRGMAHLALGHTDSAQADFDGAIALSPDYGAPYGDRALLRFQADDLAGAIADSDQAIILSTSPSETYHQAIYTTRCLSYFCLGDHTKALQDFEQLIALLTHSSSSQTSNASISIGSTGSDL
ncbi:MAG: tetratricopeptide repeat protein, partial [Phormidesmis sp.]